MRVTGPLIKVLSALLEAYVQGQEIYGLDLSRRTGIKGGTLQPMLGRLGDEKWITARWEELDPSEAKRPRRRYYRLTSSGAHEARLVLMEHSVATPAFREGSA